MYKFLFQYEGAVLYHDEYYAAQRVYNKEGKLLGSITHMLSPYYKQLGYFFGPCKNGNIILSQNSKNQQVRTYGFSIKRVIKLLNLENIQNFAFCQMGSR